MALIRSTWKDGKLEYEAIDVATTEPIGCDCRHCRSRLSRLMDTVATVGLRRLSASWMCPLGDTVIEVEMVVCAAADLVEDGG